MTLLGSVSSYFQSDFMPHGHCYLWRPEILWPHVISDAVIALSYFAIPIAMILFIRKHKDLRFARIFYLFAAFIVCCGITHLINIYTVWVGNYGLQAVAKSITALVSLVTAVMIFILLPKALLLPTPQALYRANKKAEKEKENRLKAERKNKDSEMLKVAIEASPVGMLMVNKKAEITLINHTISEIFGYSAEELLGENINILVQSDKHSYHSQRVDEFIDNPRNQHEMAVDRIITGISRSGQLVPVEIKLNAIDLDDEKFILASVTSIRQKLDQQALVQSLNRRFDRVLSATKDGLWEWEVKDGNMWWSPGLWRLLGLDENKQTASLELFLAQLHEEHSALVSAHIKTHFSRAHAINIEFRCRQKNGQYSWLHFRADTMFDATNEPVLMSGAISDITDKKLIERDLLEKTHFLESIYDGTSYGIFVIDVTPNDYVYVATNKSLEALTGIPQVAMRGNTLNAIVPEYIDKATANEIRKHYSDCVTAKAQVQYIENIQISKKNTWWKTVLCPLISNGVVTRIVGSTTEVTELILLEQEAIRREQFLSKLQEYTVAGIYIYDHKVQANRYINPRYSEITGYSLSDLAKIENLNELFHPDDLPRIVKHLDEVSRSKEGEIVSIEYRFKHKTGRWVWCLSYDSVFSRGENGELLEVIGSFIDITLQKNIFSKLENSNKQLERFAYTASHDLQEPLRKLMSFSSSIRDRFHETKLDAETKFELERISDAASRMKSLITDLLSLSTITRHQLNLTTKHLSESLADVADMLETEIRNNKVKLQLIADVEITADHELFTQLLINLISNSIKYRRKPAPVIKVSAELSMIEEVNYQVITVEDNGMGFDAKYAAEVLQPFRRLVNRSEYPGSGIGLAICDQVAQAHEGFLQVDATAGKGAIFKVFLPEHYSTSLSVQQEA